MKSIYILCTLIYAKARIVQSIQSIAFDNDSVSQRSSQADLMTRKNSIRFIVHTMPISCLETSSGKEKILVATGLNEFDRQSLNKREAD